jgi:hypothetical protein
MASGGQGRASRPKRLWAVAVVNVAAGALTLIVVGFLLANSARSVSFAWVLIQALAPTAVLSGALIASSVLALLGRSQFRWIALGSAVLYFGLHVIQSLWSYYHTATPPAETSSLATSVVDNALGIVLNLWAFLSDKTDEFFDAVAPDPQPQR